MHGMRSNEDVTVTPGIPAAAFLGHDAEDLESYGFTLDSYIGHDGEKKVEMYAPKGYKPEAIPILRTILCWLQKNDPYAPEDIALLGTCEMEDGRRDYFMVEVTDSGEDFTFPLR